MAYRVGGLAGLARAAGPTPRFDALALVTGGEITWFATPDVAELGLADDVHEVYVGDRDDITSSLGIDLPADRSGVVEDGCLYLVFEGLGCYLTDKVGKYAIGVTGQCHAMKDVHAERAAATDEALRRWRAEQAKAA